MHRPAGGHQPPAPTDSEHVTWTWDATAWAWQPQPTLTAVKRARIAQVQVAIDAAEAEQARPMREVVSALLGGAAAPSFAAAKLTALDAEIVGLRAVRAAMAAAMTLAELEAVEWPVL